MPLYDYKCPQCQKVQEELHKWDETLEITCAECGKKMTRMISSFNHFISGGGTRNRTARARYGNRRKFSGSTPRESAQEKASALQSEVSHNENLNKDPYYQHRN